MSVLLALFSALGAVLLFLLKLVGILLLIGMVLLALVLFCPFCADVQWEQGVFTVKGWALHFRCSSIRSQSLPNQKNPRARLAN